MSTTRQLVVSEATVSDEKRVRAFIDECASLQVVVRHPDTYKEAVKSALLFQVNDEHYKMVAVGMLLRLGSTHYYELAGGLVHPAWRKSGIVSSLMPLIAASPILYNPSARLVALIAPDNKPSIQLMTNAGFVRVEEYVEELLRLCEQCKKPHPADRRCCNDPYVLPRNAHFDLIDKFLGLGNTIVVPNSETLQIVLRLSCKAIDSESRNALAAFIAAPDNETAS